MKATLVINFDSEWLVAGGESLLGTADMAPLRDAEGFPVVPGRTLRGILREAVASIDDFHGDEASWAIRLFGRRLSAADSEGQTYSQGVARIGTASLVAEVAGRCATLDEKRDLYGSIRRTALDDDRVAKPHSLREMEVCIPGLCLMADVEAPTDADLHALAFACGLVRTLGHGRSRGLGRCRLSLVRDGKVVAANSVPHPPETDG